MRNIVMTLLAGIVSYSSLAQNKGGQDHLPGPVEVLSRYIQLASPTGSEKEAGVYFAGICKAMGLHVQVFTAAEDSYNFTASLYPLDQKKPNIIFLNHIDVVPATDSSGHWTYLPFSGQVTDSLIWGRGALDNKGAAIMQLFAVADFIGAARRQDLPYNVTILAVSAEENGGKLGASIMADKHFEELNPVVILGEGGAGVSGILPSYEDKKIFGIEISQKQSLSLRLHLSVKSSGHGAVPPKKYTNRIMVASLHKLMERKQKIKFTEPTKIMFNKLGKLEGGIKGFVLKNPVFFKPLLTGYIRKDPILQALVTNTVTVTHLENPPKEPNQISQEITAVLDCRLLPGTDADKFIRNLKRTINNNKMEVKVISKTLAASYSDPKNIFFEKLEASVKTIYPAAAAIPILFPASNDNNYFRQKGVPVFGLTPIYMDDELLSSIHNFNERIPIKAMHTGIAVFTHYLKSILSN